MTVWTGDETLVALIHGESGVGKTPVGHTTPAPRLILDSENGSKFIRGKKIKWDPNSEAPPAAGDWETCVVQCRDYATFLQAYAWVNSGQHCFRSVTIDSLTELQKRCRDTLFESGVGQGQGEADDMNERRWGILLTKMEQVVRDFRDLTMHQTNPLQCIVILALTDSKKGRYRPFVQGSLSVSLPGYVDLLGYLYTEETEHGIQRRMLVQPTALYVAKDRTSQLPSGGVVGVYGPVVPGPIDLSDLIDKIYSEPAA